MISTQHYPRLPGRRRLKEICKGIAVLDAILAEDWADRYYSYNSKWSDAEELGSMRDGQGDELLILFRPDGCVINGMAHDYHPKDKSRLTQGLPKMYEEFMYGEPVHSIGTTFCIWTDKEELWRIGTPADFDDGSEELLGIFDGDPQGYIDWAGEYYEVAVNEDFRNVASAVYEGKPLTRAMALAINPEIEHWQPLRNDMEEIGYPNELDSE
jgi:hypothetical protein